MLGALEEVFPGARYQRCTVHFYRNALGRVPVTRRKAAARMLKAIHAQESREVCARKAEEVAEKLESMRSGRARGRRATGSPKRWPARNSRLSTGTGSGRTTGSNASTARSGGGRGSRDLPGQQLGPHAGDGEAEVHSEARVGQGAVPGHVQTGGDGRAKGKGGGLEEDGPRTAKSICERTLTVPRRL